MKKSLLAVLGLAVLTLGAQAPAMATDYGTITVRGHAQATYVANQALVTVTTRTEKDSVQEAKAENDRMFTAFRQSLRDIGIADKDLRTSDYSADEKHYPIKDSDQYRTTYVVRNTLKVTVNDVKNVSAIVDAAAKAGITDVRMSKLGLNDADKAAQQQDLMVRAAKDARQKADALVGALGTHIVGIDSLDVDNYGYRASKAYAEVMSVSDSVDAAPVIENGQDTADMYVNVVFKVK